MDEAAKQYGRHITAFMRDESGATAIEYGLIASGIFLAIILAVKDVAGSVNSLYLIIAAKVQAALS